MRRTPSWRRYVRFWGPDVDADIDEELRFHLEMRARDYEARGASPADARRIALERFGDMAQIGDALRTHDRRRERERHRREIMGDFVQDVRFGVRGLLRAPGFTLIAVLTLVVAMLTAVLFGLAPAAQATRDAELGALRDGAAGGGLSVSRLRDAFVVAQVAMCLVLLIGAGLFARGLQRALAIDLGFRPERLIVASVNTGLVHYDTARAERYVSDAMERITAIPGVRGVSWAASLPLSGHNVLTGHIEGHAPLPGEEEERFTVNIIGAGYLRTMGTPLVHGREFTAADRPGTTPVAIINEALARRDWAGQDPIGRRIIIGDTMTVVGVAKDAKVERLDERPQPLVYAPIGQSRGWLLDEIHLVVRLAGDGDGARPVVERALHAAGPDVPVYGLATFGDQLAEVLLPQRLGAALLGAFSLLALVVAAVGMYGVVSYLVSQRTREIGIRIALGAQPGVVLRLVVGHNLRRVGVGIVIGLAVAAAVTRVAASFLYGVSATDFVTYAATSLVIAFAGAAAAYIPARRATRVSPVEAFRTE